MVYGLAADCFILFELPHIYKLFDESILIEKKWKGNDGWNVIFCKQNCSLSLAIFFQKPANCYIE